MPQNAFRRDPIRNLPQYWLVLAQQRTELVRWNLPRSRALRLKGFFHTQKKGGIRGMPENPFGLQIGKPCEITLLRRSLYRPLSMLSTRWKWWVCRRRNWGRTRALWNRARRRQRVLRTPFISRNNLILKVENTTISVQKVRA